MNLQEEFYGSQDIRFQDHNTNKQFRDYYEIRHIVTTLILPTLYVWQL